MKNIFQSSKLFAKFYFFEMATNLSLQRRKEKINHLKLPKNGIKIFFGGKVLPHVLITILRII